MALGLWPLLTVARGSLGDTGAGDNSVRGCFSGCRGVDDTYRQGLETQLARQRPAAVGPFLFLLPFPLSHP